MRCEEVSAAALGERLLTVRAGPIGGPGDGSDRFGYWVSRLAGRYVQVIDVRELAAWTIGAGRSGTVGAVDAVGEVLTPGDVIAEARAVPDGTAGRG